MIVEIEVSESNWEFLKGLMERINTQDNRCTRSPFYYVVRDWKEISREHYIYNGLRYSEEELKEHCQDQGYDFEEVLADSEKCDAIMREEYSNFFLTEQGYEQHMEMNSHNYSKSADSYIKHAFRNPELEQLLECLGEITGKGHRRH